MLTLIGSGTTRVVGIDDLARADPAKAHACPRACPAVSSQFGRPGSRRAITIVQLPSRIVDGGVLVHVGAVVAVVERFHPVVVDLEVPALARRDARHVDDERLVGAERDSSRGSSGCSGRRPRGEIARLVLPRQRVRLRREVARPVGEDARRALDEAGGVREAVRERRRVERPRRASPSDAARSSARRGAPCARSRKVWRTISIALSAVIGSQLPSCGVALTISSKRPSALDRERRAVDEARRREPAGRAVAARLGAEAEVVHRAARAR